MGVISGGCRFLTGVHAVFVVLSGKCGKSGVDSIVMDVHYIPTRGVGWMWWAESMDITRFFDIAPPAIEISVPDRISIHIRPVKRRNINP